MRLQAKEYGICGHLGQAVVADGYLSVSCSDGYQYVYGKGKTATTITAPDVSVPLGTAFTIKGTVLDQSPAQPNTPCVSKESMTTQMQYLHKQQPIGGIWGNETITGVPVTLTAIGLDGSFIDIGTVTTNGYYRDIQQSLDATKGGHLHNHRFFRTKRFLWRLISSNRGNSDSSISNHDTNTRTRGGNGQYSNVNWLNISNNHRNSHSQLIILRKRQ